MKDEGCSPSSVLASLASLLYGRELAFYRIDQQMHGSIASFASWRNFS